MGLFWQRAVKLAWSEVYRNPYCSLGVGMHAALCETDSLGGEPTGKSGPYSGGSDGYGGWGHGDRLLCCVIEGNCKHNGNLERLLCIKNTVADSVQFTNFPKLQQLK